MKLEEEYFAQSHLRNKGKLGWFDLWGHPQRGSGERMAARWDLSLLQFIVKSVVIIREDQTIVECQVMMREKDLCVFHKVDFTGV